MWCAHGQCGCVHDSCTHPGRCTPLLLRCACFVVLPGVAGCCIGDLKRCTVPSFNAIACVFWSVGLDLLLLAHHLTADFDMHLQHAMATHHLTAALLTPCRTSATPQRIINHSCADPYCLSSCRYVRYYFPRCSVYTHRHVRAAPPRARPRRPHPVHALDTVAHLTRVTPAVLPHLLPLRPGGFYGAGLSLAELK